MDKTMAMCIYCYVVIVKKGLSDKAMGQSLKEHIKECTEFSPSYKCAGTSTDQQASPARLDLQLLVSFTVHTCFVCQLARIPLRASVVYTCRCCMIGFRNFSSDSEICLPQTKVESISFRT